jgi:hypothetical protein
MGKKNRKQEDLEIEIGEQLTGEPRRGGGIGNGTVFLLSFVGFGFAMGGLVLTKAQHYSWTLHRVQRDLTAAGFEPGTMVLGGLSLIGFAMAVRGALVSARSRNKAAEKLERDLDLSVRMTEVQETVNKMQRTVEAVRQRVLENAEEQAARNPRQHEGAQSEALFRLAASLDSLGQRIDEGQRASVDALTARVGALGAEVRGELQRMGRPPVQQPAPQAQPVGPQHAAQQPAAQVQQHPQHAPAEPPLVQEDDEELTVLVSLEEEEEPGLGLLDELDDFGNPTCEGPSPALPGQPAQDDAPTLELRSLLSDERVDEAVREMRRDQGA